MSRLSRAAPPVTRAGMFARVLALFALFALIAGGLSESPAFAGHNELGAIEHAIDHGAADHADDEDAVDQGGQAVAHHHCSADVAPAPSPMNSPATDKRSAMRPVASAALASRTVAPPTEPPAG